MSVELVDGLKIQIPSKCELCGMKLTNVHASVEKDAIYDLCPKCLKKLQDNLLTIADLKILILKQKHFKDEMQIAVNPNAGSI